VVIPFRTHQETGLNDQDCSNSKIIKSSYEAFLIARIIYKQIDKKEERRKKKKIEY
tara:strand:+ start:51 stop:218 length:168 start_codon:yes stop_codon:yes gene_type:complete